jgi:hypothetical protein
VRARGAGLAASCEHPCVVVLGVRDPGAGAMLVFRGGDTPVDHPGAGRAPAAPTTVAVVRPERTIVRDVDASLPLILSSAALLLALPGGGVAVRRTRIAPRRGH